MSERLIDCVKYASDFVFINVSEGRGLRGRGRGGVGSGAGAARRRVMAGRAPREHPSAPSVQPCAP